MKRAEFDMGLCLYLTGLTMFVCVGWKLKDMRWWWLTKLEKTQLAIKLHDVWSYLVNHCPDLLIRWLEEKLRYVMVFDVGTLRPNTVSKGSCYLGLMWKPSIPACYCLIAFLKVCEDRSLSSTVTDRNSYFLHVHVYPSFWRNWSWFVICGLNMFKCT